HRPIVMSAERVAGGVSGSQQPAGKSSISPSTWNLIEKSLFSLKPTSHSTEFHGTHRAFLKIAAFAHSDSCAEHDRRPSSGMTRCGAADNNEGWPIARGTRPKTDAVNPRRRRRH